MKHLKVRFIEDHISVHSGNSHYKRGVSATFREGDAQWLIDSGIAEPFDKPKDKPKQQPLIIEPAPLTDVRGVGDELAVELNERNIKTIADLANANIEALTPISGIGTKKAKAIIDAARQSLDVVSVVKT